MVKVEMLKFGALPHILVSSTLNFPLQSLLYVVIIQLEVCVHVKDVIECIHALDQINM